MRNPQLTSVCLVACAGARCHGGRLRRFLRVDVASGDASLDTIEHYSMRSNTGGLVRRTGFRPGYDHHCAHQALSAALIEPTTTPSPSAGNDDRTALLRRGAQRRSAPRQSGGQRKGRAYVTHEDFQYLSEEELSKLLSAIPDPEAATDGTNCAACAISSWSG